MDIVTDTDIIILAVLNKEGAQVHICNYFWILKKSVFFWECQNWFITNIDSSDDHGDEKAQKSW